ncbi:MAG: trypsin-like peptidase domain-containing protein [Cyanobacteria bacterium J06639_1]
MLRRRSREVGLGLAIAMTAAVGMVMESREAIAREAIVVASVSFAPVQRDRLAPAWRADGRHTNERLVKIAQSNASPRPQPDLKRLGQLAVAESTLLANGSLVDSYRLTLTESREVTIDLRSKTFDAYLRLLDDTGIEIAQNDDLSEFNYNARISKRLQPGQYTILASTYGVMRQGAYSLEVAGATNVAAIAAEEVTFWPNSDMSWLDVNVELGRLARSEGTARDRAYRSVVQVYNGDNSGSGTLLNASGRILTNFHVIAEGENGDRPPRGPIYVGVALRPDRPVTPLFRCELLRYDVETDLALLQVTGDLLGNPLPDSLTFDFLPIGNPNRVRLGDAVTVLGFPGTTAIQAGGSSYLTLTRGVVSAILSSNGKRRDFLSDATVNAGNSGGATLNAAGELIAIPSSTVSETGRSPSDIDRASVLRAVSAIPEDWLSEITGTTVPAASNSVVPVDASYSEP